jgi:uncharacterized protein
LSGLKCSSILAAWSVLPTSTALLGPNGNVQCVVMGHGLSGTRDLGLHVYAERFAAAGMAVLVFD